MNNIEIEQLKRDIKQYLKYTDEQIENIGILNDKKLHSLKREIGKVKSAREKTTKNKHAKNIAEKKVDEIFKNNPIVGSGLSSTPKKKEKTVVHTNKPFYINKHAMKKIKIDGNRKPKILFIADVKGWAWWIKSHYLKKYLSDEFDIDVTCVLGQGCSPYSKIDQLKYDLYFTYGFSYIDFLYRVPKFKKSTGVTAHRARNVIFPKMKQAGHIHANSIMLLKELHDMGFKNAHYIPNGVNADLFKPITPIRKEGPLIVGHVGKECPAKGQREFILPAIKTAQVQSCTNLRTWKDKLPHHDMPVVYNQMDVFVVASTEDGTPNPALEAAACGRPIISNRIGNMPEFIKDGYNGFIVPRKIGAYVDKINYFKKNRHELIRMGENARKTILEGWTWKIQAENYRKMFRSIFEKQK
jgi:glycosyltransferase involved in cell wall biosynthesis